MSEKRLRMELFHWASALTRVVCVVVEGMAEESAVPNQVEEKIIVSLSSRGFERLRRFFFIAGVAYEFLEHARDNSAPTIT